MHNNQPKVPRSQWMNRQLMILKTKKETSAYVYIVLTLFTISFFGLFILRPVFSTITNLQKQLTDSKRVALDLQTKIAALQSLSTQYVTLEPELSYVYNAIPTSAQIPTLTRQMEQLASDNNLTLKDFTVSTVQFYPLEGGNKLYAYTFTLDVLGSQSDINNFMQDIANFERIISIDKITTGKKENGLELNLSGKAYFEEK